MKDRNFFYTYKPACLLLLQKATGGNLDKDEKLFLDLYFLLKYKVFCFHNWDKNFVEANFIHFTCNEDIVKLAYDRLKLFEDELLYDIKSNDTIETM